VLLQSHQAHRHDSGAYYDALGSFYYRRGSVVGEYRSAVQGPRDFVSMVQVEMVQVEDSGSAQSV
jgi:hypothetical protein